MSWQPELDQLRERERQARALGGPERVRGSTMRRLTVRERIDGFVERCHRRKPRRPPHRFSGHCAG